MRTPVLALVVALATVAPAVLAEKADREKEIQVLADKASADDNKREAVYEGNVVVTQGTLRVAAARIVVREDAEGYRSFVATGSPVTFRQKRDKTDDWVEGEALRAEFDDRTDLLKLITKARLKSAQGEITGELVSYDRGRDLFQVTGGASGSGGSAASRVKATILPPKKGTEPVKPSPPLDLKPDRAPGTGG